MKRKLLSVLGTVLLLSTLIIGALPANAAPPPPNYEPVDVGPEIRGWPATPEMIAPPDEAATANAAVTSFDCPVLDTKTFMALNDYTGRYFFTSFNLLAEGDKAQIWVQADLSWPAGDTRPTPVVTCEQIQYLLAEFENNIQPLEAEFFAVADHHDGSYSLLEAWGYFPPGYYADEAGRQIVLVSNVRDDNYYDPSYPSYIAGFYSPSFEAYFDRNVMSIDAYDWANRIGPGVSRPYLYEGVFAHEYQHLLHDDVDSDEETWVNEGCSEFAQFLCGYGHPHIDRDVNPENSLVAWGDQGDLEILSDYAHAYLWTLSLYEEFGGPFIQGLFSNELNGISGVNSTLQQFRVPKDFADLYTDWSVKCLVSAKTPAGGRYQFDNTDFSFDIGTPDAPNAEAYDFPGAPPWGTDYIWVHGDPKALGSLTFDGVEFSIFPSAWSSDGDVLWGGAGDLVDNWAIFEATGGGTLTFDTRFDIEYAWDYGFVQVSTDGGHTWTSLPNAYACDVLDPSAHPTVVANVPGFTGVSGFGCDNPYDADPYPEAQWINVSVDLSAYAGQDILLAFRYVTDWATTEAGWFVDNVYVDGTLISDGASMEPFKDITGYVPVDNNFIVTFVGIMGKAEGNQYRVLKMKLAELDEAGLFELNKLLKESDNLVMLVTSAASEGYTGYADYGYDFTFTNAGPKK